MDMVFVQPRLRRIKDGLLVVGRALCASNVCV
jgi:hypothetical protein